MDAVNSVISLFNVLFYFTFLSNKNKKMPPNHQNTKFHQKNLNPIPEELNIINNLTDGSHLKIIFSFSSFRFAYNQEIIITTMLTMKAQ